MKSEDVLNTLPDGGAVVILSGGMDSTIALRLCVEKYGNKNVHALSFSYGQKQSNELVMAHRSCNKLKVQHQILDISALGKIGMGYSANLDKNIKMPTIQDVLGDPAPLTEVPNRNMVMLSMAAAYAQTRKIKNIVCGLQVHDQYSYWDTTQQFVDSINNTLSQNRKMPVQVIAPFSHFSKLQELELLQELDGNVDLMKTTLTCYNPNEAGDSCGKCPSCAERIQNFAKFGVRDPVSYSIDIDWDKLMERELANVRN